MSSPTSHESGRFCALFRSRITVLKVCARPSSAGEGGRKKEGERARGALFSEREKDEFVSEQKIFSLWFFRLIFSSLLVHRPLLLLRFLHAAAAHRPSPRRGDGGSHDDNYQKS